jgi:methyl acetate hydrolase
VTLAEYFRQNIFAPLGMHDTFFLVPGTKWSRVVSTYVRQADGGFKASDPLPSSPPPVEFFSGGGACPRPRRTTYGSCAPCCGAASSTAPAS